jgi:hypothetical protein
MRRHWVPRVAALAVACCSLLVGPAIASAATCPTVPIAPPHTAIATSRVFGPAAVGDAVMTPSGPAAVTGGALKGVDGSTVNVTVPSTSSAALSVAVDAQGNVYYVDGWLNLVKVSPSGQQLWKRTVGTPLKSVFVLGTGTSQKVGAVMRDQPGAKMWSTDGTSLPDSTVAGDAFTAAPDGGVVATDKGTYVRVYDATGKLVRSVGYSAKDNTPSLPGSPQQFYQLGGAAELPDGRLLVTDTQRGILVIGTDGVEQGELPATDADALGLTQRSSILVSGDSVYVETGTRFSTTQYVAKLSLQGILDRATHGEAKDPRLGLGGGLTINGTNGYVPAGTAPSVNAVFDAWWGSAPGLTLCYSLYDEAGLRGDTGPVTNSSLPVSALSGIAGGVPLPLPGSLDPGAYEVAASLVSGGQAVSSTQLTFMVGAAGQGLDFSALAPGANAGGPAPARAADYASILGTGLVRVQLDWKKLLPSGTSGPTDFSAYDQQITDAAAEAQKLGVTLEVQVGQGGPERTFVDNGTWGARVLEVVNHFKDRVHVWEAWNEPNNTYGTAPNYVAHILAPFYQAVKAADPTATVVGGTVCGMPLAYWQQIVTAGGLDDMDVAGIHPYPGHNRSFEEQGTIDQLPKLRAMLQRNGQPIPIWVTELSWWSDGSYNFLHQADASARAMLWMRANGISKWAYFIPEGAWGDDGVTYSTVQTGGFTKPSALALMTTSAQLAGRPFLGTVDVGAPSAYAMRFGPRAGDPSSGELLVAWTDELRLPAVITPDQAGRQVVETDELGASQTRTLDGDTGVMLDSAPKFFALDGAGHVSIAPGEAFASDLALASSGATASASSSLSTNPARAAIDGVAGAAGGADLEGLPMWASAANDPSPTLTVQLPGAPVVDRVVVATDSNGSVNASLRDYDVQVQATAGGTWTAVGQVRGEFMRRQILVPFPAQHVAAVRLVEKAVNYSGYVGGAKPIWWQDSFYGGAVVAELRAYAPAAVDAAAPDVPPLPSAPAPVVAPPTPTPTPTPSPTPTATPTPAPTATPTPTPTRVPVTTPTPTPTPQPVVTPTPTPKPKSPKPKAAATPTPAPSAVTVQSPRPPTCTPTAKSAVARMASRAKALARHAARVRAKARKLHGARRHAALAKARKLSAQAKRARRQRARLASQSGCGGGV